MLFTIDLRADEIDCMHRALTRHIMMTTAALRSRAAAQLAPTRLEEMHADVRTAATIVGRLPIKSFRVENA